MKRYFPQYISKPLLFFFVVGLLLASTLLTICVFDYCCFAPAPPPPVIITVPSLPYKDKVQIDKDILFEKAFKRFGECMKDANKTTMTACKEEFWNSGKQH